MRWRIAAVALLLTAACGGSSEPLTTTEQKNVVGVITEIEPEEGSDVESFVVEEDDGARFLITIDEELDYGFDLAHLHEHVKGELPVDVEVEQGDDELIALSIADA